MYNIALRGTAVSDADVAKVRVYLNGNRTEVAVQPSQEFDVTIQHPTSGPITIEHSFVDQAGNESAKFSQVVTVPDIEAPTAPTAPLELVSVVWAA